MTGQLSKNFHGVGIGPRSKILAVKFSGSGSELISNFFPDPNFRLALLHGELNVGKKMFPEFMQMFTRDYASLIMLPDVD